MMVMAMVMLMAMVVAMVVALVVKANFVFGFSKPTISLALITR